MRLLFLAAVVICARAYDSQYDTQAVKSVKGGHGHFYQGGDINRFYNSNNSTNQYGVFNISRGDIDSYRPNQPAQRPPINFEIGVCYIEVPTASLVRDKLHVPAGNGSRPDMSRIRTCCQGYERNVYNFRICEPVCSKGCVNALCTAPETCSCFPDHVKNLGGVCVATCPIGCQNGRCDGGECLCNEGYKLDVDGKFCVPFCREHCAGVGNCTAPNQCQCNSGLESTPDGSCKISCGNCENGDCMSATECRCRSGYLKDSQGKCVPHCSLPCGPNERCVAPNVCSLSSGPVHGSSAPHQPNNQNPSGPSQNNTYYYNPNHPSNYPLHPQNQYGQPNPLQNSHNPNQGSNYPQINSSYPHQNPQQGSGYPYPNPNQNQQSSNYPYPNQQGSNQYNPNQPQQGGYPQPNPVQPQQGGGYPQPNPIYQHERPNYPQYPVGQNPQNNSNPHNSQYPHQPGYGPYQPTGHTINVTFSQYPLYPENQLGLNQTNYPSNYPGQQYPDSQRPGSYNHNQGHDQYPSNQQGNQQNYPSNQHGYYSPNGGPYNQNQYPYDQNQVSSLCSEPCVNGVCIDYNRCRCSPGYVTDEMDPAGNKCRPHCPGGCPNGYCAAPHSCACAEGYYRDTSVKGRAVCVKRIRRALHDLLFKIPDYDQ